jgi:hypothetical protein
MSVPVQGTGATRHACREFPSESVNPAFPGGRNRVPQEQESPGADATKKRERIVVPSYGTSPAARKEFTIVRARYGIILNSLKRPDSLKRNFDTELYSTA